MYVCIHLYIYICTYIYIHTKTRCNTVHETCILKTLRYTGTHCNVQQYTAWVHRASKTNFYEVTKATRSSSTWYDQKVSSLNTLQNSAIQCPGATLHLWRNFTFLTNWVALQPTKINVHSLNLKKVLKDLRWCIRYHSSIEKSRDLTNLGYSQVPGSIPALNKSQQNQDSIHQSRVFSFASTCMFVEGGLSILLVNL